MIDLYSWTTPNGRKVHIMLEETGLEHTNHPIDIRAGDQFEPDFLKISPNNKIPAIVDHDGPGGKPLALFESGAILIYLAEKTGKFLPTDPVKRIVTLQWLMFQMGGVGPMFGQANHFMQYAKEKIPYAIERYGNETKRLYNVMDKQLADNEFIAGDEYTIADMAIWPWCLSPDRRGVDHDDYPNVKRWFETIDARPGVQKGLKVLDGLQRAPLDEKARDIMFGNTQFQRR